MKPATLAVAEAAKEMLAAQLAHLPELRGIGIAVLDDGFGIKVNLSHQPSDTIVPDEVDGVPIIVDIVGTIRPI